MARVSTSFNFGALAKPKKGKKKKKGGAKSNAWTGYAGGKGKK